MKKFYFLFTLSLIMVTVTKCSPLISSKASCIEDYSPCSCDQTEVPQKIVSIICDRVRSEDIQSAFNRTESNLVSYTYKLTLIPSEEDEVIIADVLSGRSVNSLVVTCPTTKYILKIDQAAFTSSKTSWLTVNDCNLNQLNFAFLEGFSAPFYELKVLRSSNVRGILTLTENLKDMLRMTVENSSGFQDLEGFPSLPVLTYLYLNGNDIDDEAVDRILSSIASSPSFDTLISLYLNGNLLTRVPQYVTLFPEIFLTSFDNNAISTVTNNSLSFIIPTSRANRYVFLEGNDITEIEPGAFKGNYMDGTINLNGNKMTRFESSVFQPILKQMFQPIETRGAISVDLNPFDCTSDCHLAWLIRDNPHLLPFVHLATCSNGISFNNLNPDLFSGCPPSSSNEK